MFDRDEEFPQLKDKVYLDHSASTVAPKSIIEKVCKGWTTRLLSNPHSLNPAGVATTSMINETRHLILKTFFCTTMNDYDVVFTSNASHALYLLSNLIKWGKESHFYYAHNAHNSLVGIREVCQEKGGQSTSIENSSGIKHSNGVYGFSVENNATGHITNWKEECRVAHKSQTFVIADTAKMITSNVMDLSEASENEQPDAMVVSFYKIFGFPTGLGALIVKRCKMHFLKPTYFGGGNVEASTIDTQFVHHRRVFHDRSEFGTINYQGVFALHVVLSDIFELYQFQDMVQLHHHVQSIVHHAAQQLEALTHYNKKRVAQLYDYHAENHGSSLCLSLSDDNGAPIPYNEFLQLASLEGFYLRAGCFCNPGTCQRLLHLTGEEVEANHKQGHICWDAKDIINGKPTGLIRISFGYCSIKDDVDRFIQFIRERYVVLEKPISVVQPLKRAKRVVLRDVYFYPIKSCNGIRVEHAWKFSETGLLYDREWAVVDENNQVLNMKNCVRLSLIAPSIDVESQQLFITCTLEKQYCKELMIPLDIVDKKVSVSLTTPPEHILDVGIFSENTQAGVYEDHTIHDFLSAILGRSVRLVRRVDETLRHEHSQDATQRIAFANEGQFLLISIPTLKQLQQKLVDKYTTPPPNAKFSIKPYTSYEWLIERFRPNFIVDGDFEPLSEHNWTHMELQFGTAKEVFKKTRVCARCSLICVNKHSLKIETEPLKTLYDYRKFKGKIEFGILLSRKDASSGFVIPNTPMAVSTE